MRSTRDVCEALDRIASGPYSEFSGRLVADDDPRRSVTADGLLDATTRSAIEARFARRFAHFDPRAVHSIWMKWYVYAVVPPFLLADLLLQRTLPAALDQTRFIIGDDDRVAALVIAGPGIDTTATPPFDRLDELVFGHFAPLIDLWITRTDLTRRVLWSNVGNTFEAMCQRHCKNASARRSKNTSVMLSKKPPNWGPFRQASGLGGIVCRCIRAGAA
ncbi:MAG: ferric iron reductase protein FhuF [Alphaproteobacteria bacterium]|jgi:ferric iron reductase protein FhuF|nr:ferric iron reductase protein FhuF [Alphaproteobacteria bacterium]